jgi:prepilin-type processing-associated H-X9-DG protein
MTADGGIFPQANFPVARHICARIQATSPFIRHAASGRAQVGTVHNQGGNMVFLDDHVEWQHWWKWIELSDTAARRWNYDDKPHEEFWEQ